MYKRQEAEYLEKQQRVDDLVRLKLEAEEKAVAARAAEAAKKLAAQTASDKPAEDKTLHKPPAKPGSADKKAADTVSYTQLYVYKRQAYGRATA